MKIKLPYVPERTEKPRKTGVTMVMDKGLSLGQAKDMVEASGHLIDYVKLGFGTSYITPNLREKIELYRNHHITPYLGGTFFEAFVVRGMFEEYKSLLKDLDIRMAEVSDGSIKLQTIQKCKYISNLAKDFEVWSEVGSKEAGILISPNKWVNMMTTELEAGAGKVIAEARESGTVGIYRPNGTAHSVLINKIIAKVDKDRILWEAPIKSQQVYFIKLFGCDVNLGNIAPEEVIPLETLRLGLRGDTFFEYLPKDLKEKFVQQNNI
jgi:phosphosulfolactate synthase